MEGTMDTAVRGSRRCDHCGTGMRAAEASYWESGELVCTGCAAQAQSRGADAAIARGLSEERAGLGGWQLFRLGLIGLKIVILLAWAASH